MTENIPGDLMRILGPNEQVQTYIKQKMYHPKINVDSVAITNKRIILRHPHALGLKKDYTDFQYRDISNVLLIKGIMRATIRCMLRFGGEPLAFDYLPKSDAERAYTIIGQNLVEFQTLYSRGYAGDPSTREQGLPAGGHQTGVCHKCAAAIHVGQKFCGNCGAQL